MLEILEYTRNSISFMANSHTMQCLNMYNYLRKYIRKILVIRYIPKVFKYQLILRQYLLRQKNSELIDSILGRSNKR